MSAPRWRGIRALIEVALEHPFERPQLAAALDYSERELPLSPTLQLHRQALRMRVERAALGYLGRRPASSLSRRSRQA
ncbi:hypothetical protein [Variovorax sp. GB1P17]|uniref:hypothetical protein n=1 Tax=Variovorax sp. GB1P17 TaxID=3443740 RepID=UPI003F44FCC9